MRTRLRLNKATRDSLWSLRQQQREFYNKGVEIGLFAHGNGEYIPSNYTAHASVLSAVRKDKTHRWARQNLTLQRSGLNAGSESVRKWSKHRKELRSNLDYWKKRVKKYPEDSKVLRKHSVAEQKLSKHREAGTKRMFRKRNEEETASGAALVYGERASLIATERGVAVRLPGGLILPLRDKDFTLPDGHTLDRRRPSSGHHRHQRQEVTRRTLPETPHLQHPPLLHHESARSQASSRRTSGGPIGSGHRGINHPVFRSDGVSHSMPEEDALQKAIGAAQMKPGANCREGSRRWRRYNRGDRFSQQSKDQPQAQRSHATLPRTSPPPEHVAVGVEDLKAKAMSATARGHLRAPWSQCGSEEGIEQRVTRSRIQNAMLDRHRAFLPTNGTGILGVAPHYTSQTCSLCGELGRRRRGKRLSVLMLWRSVPSGLQCVTQCKESGIPDTDVDGGGQVRSSKDARSQPERAASQTSVLSNAPAPPQLRSLSVNG